MAKFFKGVLLLSLALIISVPVIDVILSFFYTEEVKPSLEVPVFSPEEMIVGAISEVLRAFITCYLYSHTTGKGSSMLHGIKFGLLYSALIASLYIILGGFYFNLKDPLRFVVADSAILILQGIVSGPVLYYVYRQKGT